MKYGWHIKKLSEVCSFENGDRGINYPSRADFVNQGIPFVNAGHLEEGLIQFRDMNFISEKVYNQLGRGKFSEGDILFCLRGSLGKFGIAGKGESGAIASSLIIVRPTEISIPDFIGYYFRSPLCEEMISNFAGGAAQPNLGGKDLMKFQIPIPPLPEQKQIVQILDKAFAAIDQAKANIEQNIQNAQELFQSKLNEIFSQKGEGWEEKRLKELGKIQTGTTPPTKDPSNYGGFIPFIKPAHFQKDGSLKWDDSMLSEGGLKKGRLFEANSVLMVCIGATIGKTGFNEIPVSSNQQINCLTPNDNFVSKFLYYALISKPLQSQVIQIGAGSQATLPIINKSKWENLVISLPTSKKYQQKVVEELDNLRLQIDKLDKLYRLKIESLDQMKNSILQKAFSGELTSVDYEEFDQISLVAEPTEPYSS